MLTTRNTKSVTVTPMEIIQPFGVEEKEHIRLVSESLTKLNPDIKYRPTCK